MNPKVIAFGDSQASSKAHRVPQVLERVLIPRKPMGRDPFTAQQREEIVTRFYKLDHDIARISADFFRRGIPSGHSAIQIALRFDRWRTIGQRKSDRIARAA